MQKPSKTDEISVGGGKNIHTGTFGKKNCKILIPQDGECLSEDEAAPEPKQLEKLASPSNAESERPKNALSRRSKKEKSEQQIREAKGLTSPIRSRVIAQEKLIETLRINLRDKTSEVENLVEINEKLRERKTRPVIFNL